MVEFASPIKKVGTTLGLTAAFGVGILAGIESAIMWPENKVATALTFGIASSFVNSLSYYYVVMREPDKPETIRNNLYRNTKYTNALAIFAIFFGGVMAVSNFNGMYVSFTVLGEKLNELGDKNSNDIPKWLLIGLGILFGLASCISGIIFNIKVGASIWNSARRVPLDLEASRGPLLDSEHYTSVNDNDASDHIRFFPQLRQRFVDTICPPSENQRRIDL